MRLPFSYLFLIFSDNYSVELDLSINGEAKTIELGLWDTAGFSSSKLSMNLLRTGQEEYDRLRPLSYRNTDIFLVLTPPPPPFLNNFLDFPYSFQVIFSIDSDVSYSNVKTKWVPELKHYSPDVPFVPPLPFIT